MNTNTAERPYYLAAAAHAEQRGQLFTKLAERLAKGEPWAGTADAAINMVDELFEWMNGRWLWRDVDDQHERGRPVRRVERCVGG